MGLTCSTISWVRSGEVAIVYPFSDQRNRLYILVSSFSSAMQHSRSNVECAPSRCIDSTHISSEGSKETTTKARAQRHQQLHPISILSLVRPLIKSAWNPDQIDRYICPTDIHHSNQKPSSTCMLCTTSHTFVYNQCPRLKNRTGTCQKQHQCVINTLKSGDFLHELQVRFGVAPRDDTAIYPDICQWQKKLRASCWTSSTSTSCCTSSSPKSSS